LSTIDEFVNLLSRVYDSIHELNSKQSENVLAHLSTFEAPNQVFENTQEFLRA
jgi:hypothetical protein